MKTQDFTVPSSPDSEVGSLVPKQQNFWANRCYFYSENTKEEPFIISWNYTGTRLTKKKKKSWQRRTANNCFISPREQPRLKGWLHPREILERSGPRGYSGKLQLKGSNLCIHLKSFQIQKCLPPVFIIILFLTRCNYFFMVCFSGSDQNRYDCWKIAEVVRFLDSCKKRYPKHTDLSLMIAEWGGNTTNPVYHTFNIIKVTVEMC